MAEHTAQHSVMYGSAQQKALPHHLFLWRALPASCSFTCPLLFTCTIVSPLCRINFMPLCVCMYIVAQHNLYWRAGQDLSKGHPYSYGISQKGAMQAEQRH